jgi:MYXO-CTERM domain-containing protein
LAHKLQCLADMRSATLGIALLGVVAGLSHSGTARACGATPQPAYVVDAVGPTSADAPLNTPLFVYLREDPTGATDQDVPTALTLTIQGTDKTVALKPPGAPPDEVWVPVEPLEPETTYEARYSPGFEGEPDTVWTFTTGTETQPTFSLEGKLEVTLEPGTQTVVQCPEDACICGCSKEEQAAACTKIEVPVTNARVKLPRAVGGFSKRGGVIALTDDRPKEFSDITKHEPDPYLYAVTSYQQVDLDDSEVTEVLIPLPEAETPYRPCFAMLANDARGDIAVAEPLCLEESFPAETDGTVSPDGGSGPVPTTDDGLANDQKQPTGTSEGCSMSGASASQSASAWLALLGLVSVVQRRRRRHG